MIVNQLLKGGQWPAYNFTHLKTAGFTMPEIAYGRLSQAERDAEAKRLIGEAGVEDLTLRLIYNTSESHRQIATVVGQMWRQKLGVGTELANFEWKTYLDIRGNQEFDVARSAWCGDYNEASTFLDLLTTTHGSNAGRYSNPKVDALMRASKTAERPGRHLHRGRADPGRGHGHHPHLPLRQHLPPVRRHQGLALRQRGEQLVFPEPLPSREVIAAGDPGTRIRER